MNKFLILVGVKHSGKTTTGLKIAKQLGLPFFDIDHIIEKQNGCTCRDLYNNSGVDGFQEAELNACKSLINETNLSSNSSNTIIISVGGGFCDNNDAVKLFHSMSKFVFLNIPMETAYKRIIKASNHIGSMPAFLVKDTIITEDDRKKAFLEIYNKRSKKYQSIADIVINTDKLNLSSICDTIIKKACLG